MINTAFHCFAYGCSNIALVSWWHVLFAKWPLFCTVFNTQEFLVRCWYFVVNISGQSSVTDMILSVFMLHLWQNRLLLRLVDLIESTFYIHSLESGSRNRHFPILLFLKQNNNFSIIILSKLSAELSALLFFLCWTFPLLLQSLSLSAFLFPTITVWMPNLYVEQN